jgi:hypothetical protein
MSLDLLEEKLKDSIKNESLRTSVHTKSKKVDCLLSSYTLYICGRIWVQKTNRAIANKEYTPWSKDMIFHEVVTLHIQDKFTDSLKLYES